MNKYEKEGEKKEGNNKQGSKEGEGIVQENIKAYQVYEQSEKESHLRIVYNVY